MKSKSNIKNDSIVAIRQRTGAEGVTQNTNGVHLWSPEPDQIHGLLGESIATSLAAAFSSKQWRATPMPLGDRTDPHSARGILAALAGKSQILLASAREPGMTVEAQRIVGCVLGAVLDRELIEAYGLAPYDAQAGDGLLAYIGVVPAAQGMRLHRSAGHPDLLVHPTGSGSEHAATSLADALFSGWLRLPVVQSCPAVFVRTRQVLKPIIHLANKHGFEFSGRFTLDFHGERQDRIVYRRDNRPLVTGFDACAA